jgi:hypothetical protein
MKNKNIYLIVCIILSAAIFLRQDVAFADGKETIINIAKYDKYDAYYQKNKTMFSTNVVKLADEFLGFYNTDETKGEIKYYEGYIHLIMEDIRTIKNLENEGKVFYIDGKTKQKNR